MEIEWGKCRSIPQQYYYCHYIGTEGKVVSIGHLHAKGFKGQLISECLFDFLKFSKKPTQKFEGFLP
jgi:hypothetical protein